MSGQQQELLVPRNTLQHGKPNFQNSANSEKLQHSMFNRKTKQHQQAGQHKLALLVVDRCEHLLESSAHRRLLQFSCDQWAQTHIKKKAWQAAIDAYTEGLTLLPKDHHLQRNAIATWQQWAATHIESKEWNNAISIYQKALQNHPGNNRLKQGLNFCQQQLNN